MVATFATIFLQEMTPQVQRYFQLVATFVAIFLVKKYYHGVGIQLVATFAAIFLLKKYYHGVEK